MQSLPEDSAIAQDVVGDGIQKIHVAGFCSLKDIALEPGRLTLLIGPNGAGKSNLLQALRLIPLLRTRSLQRYVAEHGFGAALLPCCPAALRPQNHRVDQDRCADPRLRLHLSLQGIAGLHAQTTPFTFKKRQRNEPILMGMGRSVFWVQVIVNHA